MYDLIIAGAGPAGITAGIYAARKRMNFLIVTDDIGGQTALSSDVENYTGYQFISGIELVAKFKEHLKKFNIEIKLNEPVVKIRQVNAGDFAVDTKESSYKARTIIVASGRRSRGLNVEGEDVFKNKGVSYCATCDGPIFAKKAVAVIGGGNSALDATLQMMNIASHVYLVDINPVLGGDLVMREKVVSDPRVTVLNGAATKAIKGKNLVTGLLIEQKGALKNLDVEGVFIEIGSIPNSDFIDFVDKNKDKEIRVDNLNRTSAGGVFAAGDVTDVPEKQIIVAAGEGAKAVLGVFRYLSQLRS